MAPLGALQLMLRKYKVILFDSRNGLEQKAGEDKKKSEWGRQMCIVEVDFKVVEEKLSLGCKSSV